MDYGCGSPGVSCVGCRHGNLRIYPYMGCGCGNPGVSAWAVGMATYVYVRIILWVVGVAVRVSPHGL